MQTTQQRRRPPQTRLYVEGKHRGHVITTRYRAPMLADCECGTTMLVSLYGDYTMYGDKVTGLISDISDPYLGYYRERIEQELRLYGAQYEMVHPRAYRVRNDGLAVRTPIAHTGNRAGYLAILKESRRLGMPRSYKGDVYKWAREQLLAADAPTIFGWSVGRFGCALYRPDLDKVGWFIDVQKRSGYIQDRYYLYNGKALHFLGEQEQGADKLDRVLRPIYLQAQRDAEAGHATPHPYDFSFELEELYA